MQVALFFLALLKLLIPIGTKHQRSPCNFRYQELYPSIAVNPVGAAFHVATDTIFSPFSSIFAKCTDTITPYGKTINSNYTILPS